MTNKFGEITNNNVRKRRTDERFQNQAVLSGNTLREHDESDALAHTNGNSDEKSGENESIWYIDWSKKAFIYLYAYWKPLSIETDFGFQENN